MHCNTSINLIDNIIIIPVFLTASTSFNAPDCNQLTKPMLEAFASLDDIEVKAVSLDALH